MEMNVGRERACNDQEHSKTVISVLIIYVLEILDSVKYLPNGSAPHTQCVIKLKNLRLCSSRFKVEPMNIISAAFRIYY